MKNLTAASISSTAFPPINRTFDLPVYQQVYVRIIRNKIYINHFFTTVSANPPAFYDPGIDTVSRLIGSIFHSSGLT